ncbi:hypothetical protein [Actinomadura harenae]|uniref:Uncharacterized protein n=1 Tax=Actinomadura harenae TaxID=2483351 RepID=A0A3M2LMA6_9ACTN|nr:hypothetical protein [Actinomadura harenae]RMI38571.1 hypothetical protein EBO15_32480 [Actinomadura harenae]
MDIESVVKRMALREVRAHFLVPSDQAPGEVRPPAPPVTVLVRTCPVCGADADAVRRYGRSVPFAHWEVREESAGLPTLTILGCEWLAPRAVLPMAIAIERHGGAVSGFSTRAASLVRLGRPAPPEAVRLLDAEERWADALDAGDFAGTLTLPAATRPTDGDGLVPLFLGPHTGPGGLNDLYLNERLRAAEAELAGARHA